MEVGHFARGREMRGSSYKGCEWHQTSISRHRPFTRWAGRSKHARRLPAIIVALGGPLAGYARTLSQAGTLRQGALTVDLANASRTLIIAVEKGALTVPQGQALRAFMQSAAQRFPNIKIVLTEIP